MTTGEYVAIGGFAVAIIGAIGGFTYKISASVKQVSDEQEAKLKQINDDQEQRRKRIYERIDEVKEQHNEKFRSKEICEILHGQLQKDVGEIKSDVKLLLERSKPPDG